MTSYTAWRAAFADALDDRFYTIDWLDSRIADGSALCLSSDTAAIVTEIREYPTGAKDIHGLIAAGDLETIVNDLIPAAEALGRQLGCIGAIIESREGWTKVLCGAGYQPYQTAVRKEF